MKWCNECNEYVYPDEGRCPNCNNIVLDKKEGRVNLDDWYEDEDESEREVGENYG